jgi:hypothetical protein
MDAQSFLATVLIIIATGFAAYAVLRQAIGDGLKDYDLWQRGKK